MDYVNKLKNFVFNKGKQVKRSFNDNEGLIQQNRLVMPSFRPQIASPVPPPRTPIQPNFAYKVNEVKRNVLRPFAATQRFMESPKRFQAPQFTPFSEKSINGKIGNFATNMGSQIATDIVNVPMSIGSDTGRVIGNKLMGRDLPQYNSLKSPLFRGVYNLKGQNATPTQVIGNVGGVASDALTAFTPKFVFNAANNAMKYGGQSMLKKAIIRGGTEGAIAGGAYGGAYGLSEGRGEKLSNQLLRGGEGLLGGAVAGGAFGGAIGVGGYAVGRISKAVQNAVKTVFPKARPDEIKTMTQQIIRDEFGRFSKTGKPKVNFYTPMENGRKVDINVWNAQKAEIRKQLGLPDRYDTGFIKPDEFVPQPKTKPTWEQFYNQNKANIDIEVNKVREQAKTIPDPKNSNKYFQEEMRNIKNRWINKYSDSNKVNPTVQGAMKEVGVEYQGSHRPTVDGDSAHEIQNFKELKNRIVQGNHSQGLYSKLEKIQGNPDAEITIYRSSPKKELNAGDWVTIDKDYAQRMKNDKGSAIHSYKVKAKDLKYDVGNNSGNGFNFGYQPQSPKSSPLNYKTGDDSPMMSFMPKSDRKYDPPPPELKRFTDEAQRRGINDKNPLANIQIVKDELEDEMLKAKDKMQEIGFKYIDKKRAMKTNKSARELMSAEDRAVYDEAEKVFDNRMKLLSGDKQTKFTPKLSNLKDQGEGILRTNTTEKITPQVQSTKSQPQADIPLRTPNVPSRTVAGVDAPSSASIVPEMQAKTKLLQNIDDLKAKAQTKTQENNQIREAARAQIDSLTSNDLKDIASVRAMYNSKAGQAGDIETLYKKNPQLMDRVINRMRELTNDSTSVNAATDEEMLQKALNMPTKSSLKLPRPQEYKQIKDLELKAKDARDLVYHGEPPKPKQVDPEEQFNKELKEWSDLKYRTETKTFKETEKENIKTILTSIEEKTNEALRRRFVSAREGKVITNKAGEGLENIVLENSHKWKEKPKVSYVRETMERNFDDVMGKDAPEMKKTFLDPVHKSESDRTRWLNKERAEVKSLGIKARSEESKLVQQLGEGLITIDDVLKKFKGDKKKTDQVVNAVNVLRRKYDTYLEDLNKVLVKNGYDPIPKRSDYFLHFQEIDNAIERYGIPIRDNQLPTDINGLTADFKPGKSFFSSALPRLGKKTNYDAITGIDKYIEGASRQRFHTDNIQRLRLLESALRAKYEGTTHMSNLVSELGEYTNLLAGKKSMIDRAAEQIVGRNIYNAAGRLKKQVGANMVGANISSSLTNYIPLTHALATTNKISFTKGMMQTIGSVFKSDGFVDRSDFLTRRFGSDRLSINKWDKAAQRAGWLFKTVDHFVSSTIVRSKFDEGLGKGLSPAAAMKQADDWAAKIMADRSVGATPTLFNSQTLGALTQFQLEVNNQLSFMFKDIPRNYDKKGMASALAQVFLYSYLFNGLFEKATGRRPAFDPIGLVQSTYEDFNDPDINKAQATKNFMRKAGEQLPFTSIFSGGRIPIGAAIPDYGAIATGESDVLTEHKKPFYYLLPVAGGGQLKKTVEGIDAYQKGYSESKSGKVRFPIEESAGNAAKTTVFGQYATDEGRDYFREGRKTLGPVQTEEFKATPRDEQQEFYDSILEERRQNKEEDAESSEGGTTTKKKKESGILASGFLDFGGDDAEYVQSKDAPKNIIAKLALVAHASTVDPKQTIKAIFTSEVLRKVTGDAVILERKEGLSKYSGEGQDTDHIIPLSIGGDNSDENLRPMNEAEKLKKTKLEQELYQGLESGKISKKEATERIKKYIEDNHIISPTVAEMKASGAIKTETTEKADKTKSTTNKDINLKKSSNPIEQARIDSKNKSTVRRDALEIYDDEKLSLAEKRTKYKELGTNESDVEFHVIDALTNDRKAPVVFKILKDREFKSEKINTFIDKKIMTTQLVEEMKSQGLIDEEKAKVLKAYIKAYEGSKSGKKGKGGGKKGKKLKLANIKTKVVKAKFSLRRTKTAAKTKLPNLKAPTAPTLKRLTFKGKELKLKNT